jgi:sn-glycerol 3-phosphate transport system substrate-binding protein
MRRSLIIGMVALMALAGCGGDDNEPSTGGGGGGGGAGSLPECPLDALAAAPKPVDITYWHAMTRVPAEELARLTTRFNRQQNDVHVTLSGAASYADNTTRFKAGLGTGKLPDLFQGEDTALQTMIDSRAAVPMQSCLAADNADTGDFVPRVLAYYTVQDVLWPMPFNNSNPILYYNKAAFRRAGLDPDKPPTTLDELRTVSQRIVDKKASPFGIAIKTDSWVMEHWLAKSGHTIVDNDNGRRARATKVTFDDETGTQLFAWIDQMVEDKLALSTSTADIDHYLAVANDRAAMTIDSSAALGTIEQILGAGEFGRVEFGAGPMPGPDNPEGGVLVGGPRTTSSTSPRRRNKRRHTGSRSTSRTQRCKRNGRPPPATRRCACRLRRCRRWPSGTANSPPTGSRSISCKRAPTTLRPPVRSSVPTARADRACGARSSTVSLRCSRATSHRPTR